MPTAAPADDVEICRPVGGKKRKGGSVAANDERTPPKKKYKKRYCSAEGCNNWRIKGGVCMRHGGKVKRCSMKGCPNYAKQRGVCIRHGAKFKRCSSEGCTNQAQNGGVCIRHGAKKYQCSSEGCTNQVQKGGVCIRHGANLLITPSTKARVENRGNEYQPIQQQQQHQQHQQEHNCMGSTSRFTSLDHHPYLHQWNKNYHKPYNSIRGGHPYCNFEGCSTIATQGDLCSTHWTLLAPLLARGNIPRGRIQEGNDQNDLTLIVSDNEDEGEGKKKQSPIASQKQETHIRKHQSETTTSNDTSGDGSKVMNNKITGNEGTDKDSQNGVAELASLGRVANLKYGNEQGKSDTILQNRASEESNLNDNREGVSGVALMQEGEEVSVDATEDSDGCGGDDHNECDFGGGDDRDVQASKDGDDAKLEEMTKKFEAEKADLNLLVEASSKESNELKRQVEDLSSKIRALETESEEAVRKEAALTAELAEVTKNYEDSNLLSKSKESEIARKEAELQTSAVELKKMTTDVATLNAKLTMGAQNEAAMRNRIDDFSSERNRLESTQLQQQSTIEDLCDKLKERKTELKEKDEKIADLKRKEQISVNELKEASTSLEEANSRNVLLTKQLEDTKQELMHKEDEMAKEEAERKRLHSSIDAAKRAHAAEVETLNSDLIEVKASKAEVESQLQLKIVELQEMTGKVSDAEERVKSAEEKLIQELQTKRNEVSQLSANVENMKGQQEDALKREAALMGQLERLQSQMEIIQDSKIKLEQEKATNDALLRTWQNEANENSNIAERLSAKLKSKEVEMKKMSTEIAALNAKLAEHAQGSDIAKLERQMGTLREELGMANIKLSKQEEELDKANVKISKQEETSSIAMKKIEELEESAKKSPKRVQTLRRSKSSLESLDLEEQPRSSDRSSTPCYEEDAHLVKMIENEIVYNGQKVTFTDIAGLEDEKEAIQEEVIFPLKWPDIFTGLRAPAKGLLLFGPPGTGKTMIGKAIAHESDATFFSISASSLASKWAGESEKLVKYLFAEASARVPSVVFIDEVDSFLSQRKMNEEEGSRKAKTEFLVQLDGVGSTSSGIFFIGATNCPQDLDDAARRRFGTRLYIPLPDQHGREALLRHALRENSHSLSDIDFANLSRDTEGFSGADMQILCTRAGRASLRFLLRKGNMMDIDANDIPPISYEHFRQSLSRMNPSVSSDDLQMYIDWNDAYGSR